MISVKCPRCQRLLFKVEPNAVNVEIKFREMHATITEVGGQVITDCTKCNTPLVWSTETRPPHLAQVRIERKLIEE